MDALKLRISTWKDARILAESLTPQWLFRGQRDASWDLKTSIERAGRGDTFMLPATEQRIIHDFKRKGHQFLKDPPQHQDDFGWAATIQHYGGPTRLLDFTRSIYVAAFFALESASGECAIWCVEEFALHDALEVRAGLKFSTSMPHWELAHKLTALANGFFTRNSNDAFVIAVEPFRLHRRLTLQQGLFLCPSAVDLPFMQSLAGTLGLAPDVSYSPEPYAQNVHSAQLLNSAKMIKLVLAPEMHRDALEDLWKMNITAASLFPGLEGFARSLYHYCRVG